MAKIMKRSLDAVRSVPLRKQSYEAPFLRRAKKPVPEEYRTFKKAPKKRGVGCLIFLFLLFAVALAGFYYWNNRSTNSVTHDSLELNVTGPEKIVAGDQATYVVEYKNLDNVPLQQMELNVAWPAGFYYDESTQPPRDANATTWLLEDLPAGGQQKLEIKGQLVGQKDEKLSATFTLGYQPENFNSEFKDSRTVTTLVTDSKIEVAMTAVDKTLVGREQEIIITFHNLTEQPLIELSADILYPDDLEIISEVASSTKAVTTTKKNATSAVMGLVKNGDYWSLNLEPQAEKQLVVKGTFPAESKPQQLLVVEVGNLSNEKFRRLARAEKAIAVINPQFEMKLQINGQEGDRAVNWSDVLRYQLEIKNNSGADISEAKVTALVDGAAVDWFSLDTIGNKQEPNIIWTKDQDATLVLWPAGESKTFTWQIKVISDPEPERMIENIIKLEIVGLNDWQQVFPSVVLTVGESLTFNNGLYWDLGGRQVGSGLLPPRVGVETSYLTVWSLPQATGDFNEVTVSTVLPPSVTFAEEVDTQEGDLSFDKETKTLTWQLKNFNKLLLPVAASFIIEVTPTKDDRGQTMVLLNPTEVTAQGKEEVIIKSKSLKTSDVVAKTNEPIGIVQ
jgi:hypothetical protein